ncbi:MAG: hypothetical protein ACI837_001498 [Crocinitomicaceae bacterium]|jgi:hypothetical protein
MSNYKETTLITSDRFVQTFSGVTPEVLANEIDASLLADGYSAKSGAPGDGIYNRGNKVVRILLGAFYKYFEFYIRTETIEGGDTQLTVKKTTSGWSGGLIGVSQVKTELRRLEAKFKGL